METPEETAINQDFIDRLKSRDKRWAEVDHAIKMESELRTCTALIAVLETVNEMAAEALEKLITADPTDTKLMISLQASVMRARIIGNTLETIRRKGVFAEQSLRDEGTVEPAN